MNNQSIALLKLTVNNHPGVLAHVCGLFARRAYNLEGVMVRPLVASPSSPSPSPAPSPAFGHSRMWLLVNEEQRLQQLIRQTEKLIDVINVEQHELEGSIFEQTEAFFAQ